MNTFWKTILAPFASLKLTVVLMALSIILVFAGTWAQIDEGIWQVQRKYFHSFFLIIDFNVFLPRTPPDLSGFSRPIAATTEFLISALSKLRFPMLGGYSLIILLLLNLLAAHTLRFKLNRKRTGILLIHAGLILLILGEVVTSLFAVETQMVIDEGQTVSFTSDIRTVEIAVIDPAPSDHDNVTAIPARHLGTGSTIVHKDLPFDVHVDEFFPNSTVLGPFQAKQIGREDARATAGAGKGLTVVGIPQFSGTEADKIDAPSAYVSLSRQGQSLGTYLLSTLPLEIDGIDAQAVLVDGRTYRIGLRFKRYDKPYSMKLIDFRHDRFTGTNRARNFSSLVRLLDPANNVDREVKIWMNHPLRYNGETFYQASFKPGDRTTILQVVRNPGWLIPYISCTMVALGMLVHFGLILREFFRKRAAAATQPRSAKPQAKPRPELAAPRPGLLWPAIITSFCVVYLFSKGAPDKQEGKYDLNTFGRIPVSYEGRVMPLDSLARNSLRILSGKSELFIEDKSRETWFHRVFNLPAGKSYPATYWLLTTMADPMKSRDLPVIRIDHPEILSQLNLDNTRKRFSVKEIMDKREVVEKQATLAQGVDPKKRDLYQKKVLELVTHVNLFFRIAEVDGLYLAPPTGSGQDWQPVAAVLSDKARPNPGVSSLLSMIDARHEDKPDGPAIFESAGAEYANWLDARLPDVAGRLNTELIFNHVEPFYAAIVLYVLIFLLICFSWLGWTGTLQRAALWVLVVTLAFHTLGLIARIYIQGRPPVTNLYSSAIFIAWGAGLMCLGLELVYRNGIGSLMAATIGFLSLIVAHNLAGSGDTMQMMEAVLDTNIWLATHVVVVVLGYAATFLAGFLAIAYILLGVLTPALRERDRAATLYRMVYGIVCFAMLFSFVGTVLGGIWADQSWGRFWGWDPKENGAVLIVFWNAIILHARWGGLVQARGVMNLAIFGNAVTSWSWFGTNMLGVGLHSYGFMDSAVFWLVLFVLLQLAVISLGSLPLSLWRSFWAPAASQGEPIRGAANVGA